MFKTITSFTKVMLTGFARSVITPIVRPFQRGPIYRATKAAIKVRIERAEAAFARDVRAIEDGARKDLLFILDATHRATVAVNERLERDRAALTQNHVDKVLG